MPIPGGSTVTVRGDYELPDTMLARMADRLGMERAIARDIDRANDAYRRLCEAVADDWSVEAAMQGKPRPR